MYNSVIISKYPLEMSTKMSYWAFQIASCRTINRRPGMAFCTIAFGLCMNISGTFGGAFGGMKTNFYTRPFNLSFLVNNGRVTFRTHGYKPQAIGNSFLPNFAEGDIIGFRFAPSTFICQLFKNGEILHGFAFSLKKNVVTGARFGGARPTSQTNVSISSKIHPFVEFATPGTVCNRTSSTSPPSRSSCLRVCTLRVIRTGGC